MTTVLITGSTDGIGLQTAKQLAAAGHDVALHGRNVEKVTAAEAAVQAAAGRSPLGRFVADLSQYTGVASLADQVAEQFDSLDVLINNAGVFHTPQTMTAEGLDIRFAVNTIAPFVLTKRLLPLVGPTGRIVNLSSAAQSPVDLDALAGRRRLDDGLAYAQSKLALTMWSRHLADELGQSGPVIVAVNPGSLLATKMVKEGYGIAGNDINIGADILTRATLSDEFTDASGRYYDNDSHRFANPHPDALDPKKNAAVVAAIEAVISQITEGAQ